MSQNPPLLHLKSPHLALLAVGLETAGMFALDPESWDLLRRLLIISGFSLALVFTWLNRGFRPMQVLAVGLVMNLFVMLANGGLMPVTPENAVRAGFAEEIADVQLGDAIPRSKDILKSRDDTVFAPISDVLVLPRWFPGRAVASPGDAIIAVAVLLAAASVLRTLAERQVAKATRRESPALNASGQS